MREIGLLAAWKASRAVHSGGWHVDQPLQDVVAELIRFCKVDDETLRARVGRTAPEVRCRL